MLTSTAADTIVTDLQLMPIESVLRWKHGRYTYVALKVGDNNWYTTATDLNTNWSPQMSSYDLAVAFVTHGVKTVTRAEMWR